MRYIMNFTRKFLATSSVLTALCAAYSSAAIADPIDNLRFNGYCALQGSGLEPSRFSLDPINLRQKTLQIIDNDSSGKEIVTNVNVSFLDFDSLDVRITT